MKPLKTKVVVIADAVKEKTAGGIIIPDTAKEEPSRGTVVEVGSEVKDVANGDEILYGKYAGTKFHHHDEDMLVMDVDDILVVL